MTPNILPCCTGKATLMRDMVYTLESENAHVAIAESPGDVLLWSS